MVSLRGEWCMVNDLKFSKFPLWVALTFSILSWLTLIYAFYYVIFTRDIIFGLPCILFTLPIVCAIIALYSLAMDKSNQKIFRRLIIWINLGLIVFIFIYFVLLAIF